MSPDPPKLLKMYQKMFLIRRVEERLEELFRAGEIYGSLHLCIGQEATVTGACAALRKDDFITCTYRGHGAVLAKGTTLKFFMAEMLGKESGSCKGRGGSMLHTDLTAGNLGASGIVAGNIPTAIGAALGSRLSKNDHVTVAFFGEGATNQGTFHEALNMAGLWKLPCIFFCENNEYAEMTHISKEASVERIADRGCAYGIPGVTVDGNDVQAVYEVTANAVLQARQGKGPTLIEAKTYRFCGHMFGDPQTYRTKDELEARRLQDPLLLARRKLAVGGIQEHDLERVHNEVEMEIAEALAFARKSPEPAEEGAENYVFA